MSYYCIVNIPGVPAREIAALTAAHDDDARTRLAALAADWPGFETIALYQNERAVMVLANPALGFPPTALEVEERAA